MCWGRAVLRAPTAKDTWARGPEQDKNEPGASEFKTKKTEGERIPKHNKIVNSVFNPYAALTSRPICGSFVHSFAPQTASQEEETLVLAENTFFNSNTSIFIQMAHTPTLLHINSKTNRAQRGLWHLPSLVVGPGQSRAEAWDIRNNAQA